MLTLVKLYAFSLNVNTVDFMYAKVMPSLKNSTKNSNVVTPQVPKQEKQVTQCTDIMDYRYYGTIVANQKC